MGDFAITLALGVALGSGCGLALASVVIGLLERAGRAVRELDDDDG